MAADKLCFHAKRFHLAVNIGFDAPHVCDDAVFPDDFLKLPQIFDIFSDRCAEKYVIAVAEIFHATEGTVCNQIFVPGLFDGREVSGRRDDGEIRIK